MANHAPAQEQCPNCGRHETTADRRYGSKRKRNDFLRRAFGNPLATILVAFALADIFFMPDIPAVLRYPVAVAAFAVIIVAIIRNYRGVYGADAATRYPDARYTCRVCGLQWTSGGSQTTAAGEDVEPESILRGAPPLQPIRATDQFEFDWGGCLGIAVPLAVGLALLAALAIAALISHSS
jgi:hypothetical protein